MEAEAKYVMQTYARPPEMVLTHGAGCKVYDVSGKEFIDFSGGIAVNCLGHSDPRWLESVTKQAGQLAHTSNLFHTIPHVQLAERLVTTSFADKVFFCNSGAEANEAAIKFARKYARQQAGVEMQDPDAAAPSTFVAFSGSFHGRTMGSVALTAKTQYQHPFMPIMPGVKQVGPCDWPPLCVRCRLGMLPCSPGDVLPLKVRSVVLCAGCRWRSVRPHSCSSARSACVLLLCMRPCPLACLLRRSASLCAASSHKQPQARLAACE